MTVGDAAGATHRVQGTSQIQLLYYPVAIGSFFLFLITYHVISPVVSRTISSGYGHLSDGHRIEWNNRVGSTVHAVIVSCICVYTLLLDMAVRNDPIWIDSPMVRAVCAFVVGYMLADTIIMVLHYTDLGEAFYIIHHAMSIYAYYYVMSYGICPYFANYRLMAEFSTPFVNQRWFFDTLKYPKSSQSVLINGVAMTATFFLVRILCMPYYWYVLYTVYATPDYLRLGYTRYILLLTSGVLDVINIAWFFKMCKGILKFFTPKDSAVDTRSDTSKSA